MSNGEGMVGKSSLKKKINGLTACIDEVVSMVNRGLLLRSFGAVFVRLAVINFIRGGHDACHSMMRFGFLIIEFYFF